MLNPMSTELPLALSGQRNSRVRVRPTACCDSYLSTMVIEGETFYRKNQALQAFTRVTGWQHPGEELVLRRVAPLVRSKRILDVGIGGGRTVGFLTLLTDQYVGIDYSDLMVGAAKERYPELDLRVGDARDLSDFDDGSFDFVYFSYNGIDTMDDSGRRAVLAASHRVLDKDGLYVFSTLNKDGPSFRETPFQLHRPGRAWDLTRAQRLVSPFVERAGPCPASFTGSGTGARPASATSTMTDGACQHSPLPISR